MEDGFGISPEEVCAVEILRELAASGTRAKRAIRVYRCLSSRFLSSKRQAEAVVEHINAQIGMATYGNLDEWWTFGAHEGQIEAIPRGYTQEQIEADRARYVISK